MLAVDQNTRPRRGDRTCASVKRENLTELVGKSVTLSKLLAAVFAITAGSSVTVVGSSVGLDPVGNGQEAGDEFNLCFTLSAISH